MSFQIRAFHLSVRTYKKKKKTENSTRGNGLRLKGDDEIKKNRITKR